MFEDKKQSPDMRKLLISVIVLLVLYIVYNSNASIKSSADHKTRNDCPDPALGTYEAYPEDNKYKSGWRLGTSDEAMATVGNQDIKCNHDTNCIRGYNDGQGALHGWYECISGKMPKK